MYWINNQIKFWETVSKHAKHSVRKKKADRTLKVLREFKEEADKELADFYEYQRKTIEQFDTITKATLD